MGFSVDSRYIENARRNLTTKLDRQRKRPSAQDVLNAWAWTCYFLGSDAHPKDERMRGVARDAAAEAVSQTTGKPRLRGFTERMLTVEEVRAGQITLKTARGNRDLVLTM